MKRSAATGPSPNATTMAAFIHLQNKVELLLAPGAVIVGTPHGFDLSEPNPCSRYQDLGHSHFYDSLMWGENITNLAIVFGVRFLLPGSRRSKRTKTTNPTQTQAFRYYRSGSLTDNHWDPFSSLPLAGGSFAIDLRALGNSLDHCPIISEG
jgi:hypothetical protein